MRKLGKRVKTSLKEIVKIVLILTAVFVVVNVFIGELMVISGSSMEPNFHDHEQIFSEKVSYRFTSPKRGDIVVVKHPQTKNRLVIKRVIGLSNETLLISHGQVFVDNKKIEEEYISENVSTTGKSIIQESANYKIPENSYVVLGDNRADSVDSREWGPITENNIVAKVLLVYYPFERFGVVTF